MRAVEKAKLTRALNILLQDHDAFAFRGTLTDAESIEFVERQFKESKQRLYEVVDEIIEGVVDEQQKKMNR